MNGNVNRYEETTLRIKLNLQRKRMDILIGRVNVTKHYVNGNKSKIYVKCVCEIFKQPFNFSVLPIAKLLWKLSSLFDHLKVQLKHHLYNI